ncbi:hypothetical protein BPT24_204 [Tenacibaculum phage pT24]|uniref:Uncharacterized protein n=1 Tax=Tenacibaculum phage pT24 TaxID=1880590 RepID=A0A1B4XX08_9CAUD|nr:hypothetical protein HYP10_gp204 [Tenacibaculum phage pT24]BAV39328.1 hypothetical protein BPT24_204 [Tenacibaculum phage pT24]
MRTKEEIKLAELTLQKCLENVQRFSMFGDDNHEQINAGLRILRDPSPMYKLDEELTYYEDEIDDMATATFILSLGEWFDGNEELVDIIWGEENLVTSLEDEPKNKVPVVCVKLCKDCPFSKTSLKGFLADYEVDDFTRMMSANFSFPCHKNVKDDMTLEAVQQKINNSEMFHCRGYIESFIKSGRTGYGNPKLQEAIDEVKKQGLSDNSMSDYEFKYHHDYIYMVDTCIKKETDFTLFSESVYKSYSPKSFSIDEVAERLQKICLKGHGLEIMGEVRHYISGSFYNRCIGEQDYKSIIRKFHKGCVNLNIDEIYELSINTLKLAKYE